MTKTVKDIETKLEQEAPELLKLRDFRLMPDGYRCKVRLRGSKDKGMRRDASFEKYWSPQDHSIVIEFEREPELPRPDPQSHERIQPVPRVEAANPEPRSRTPQPPAQPSVAAPATHDRKSGANTDDPLSDLIRALDHAESRPGYSFVSLKWFRDTALASESFSWAAVDSERQTVLRNAIDRRLVLTSKVPNPKSPQFPVTAIRLNRLMPEVKAILNTADNGLSDFEPIPIRGGNLSTTILRDRR